MSHSDERIYTLKNEMLNEKSFVDVDQELYKRVKKWSTEERKMQKRICKAEITEWTSRNPLHFSTLVFSSLNIILPFFLLLFNMMWDIDKSISNIQVLAFMILWLALEALFIIVLQSREDRKKKRKLYYFSYILACIEDVEKELGEQ